MFMADDLYLNTRSHKVVSTFPYGKEELLLLILWSFFLKKSTLSGDFS